MPQLASQLKNDLAQLIQSETIEFPGEDVPMDKQSHRRISEKLESLGYRH